jgi:hypothetical protein
MRPPHVQVDQRRAETPVTQQLSDRQQIHARFQKSGRETVTQRVRRDALLEARFPCRCLAGFLDRVRTSELLTWAEFR